MDSYFLTLGGTTVDVGSWTRADPGPDWGTHDLIRAAYAENPVAEGGRLAYETVGVRRLGFPLILPSGGAGLSLAGLESLLGLLARPGAVLDVKPQGVASGDMVRFDVLTGRWEPDPNIRHWEVGVRLGTLRLDTQPFAYLPTWITLASVASVGLPGRLTVPGASVLGDVPGFAQLITSPTQQTVATIIGSWLVDTVAWSLGGQPSLLHAIPGGSWAADVPSSVNVTREEAVFGNTAQRLWLSPTQTGWAQIAHFDISAAVMPDHRGRFRAFGWMAQSESITATVHSLGMLLDSTILNPVNAMASAQQIATLGPQIGSVLSPQLIDLGEITLPPVASGISETDTRLRLWAHRATYAGTLDSRVYFSGLSLLPIDKPNGILAQGAAYPHIVTDNATQGRLHIDGRAHTVLVGQATGAIATPLIVADRLGDYRGGFPAVEKTTVALDLIGAQRKVGGPTTVIARTGDLYTPVLFRYQPRFLFLKGEV